MSTKTGKQTGNFLIQGSILAAAGIIVRIIGLAYRIPLIRIIGDEGMGYYSVAYEIYSVVLLLSSYSLPLAVSKMISSRIEKEEYVNAHRIFKAALVYATVIGGAGCIFVLCSAGWFADVFYKLPLCRYAIISLAPTVWIMAYLGVFRGYFQGRSTMIPTAVSQILEQVANALVSVGASWWLCNAALKAAKGESVASAWGAAGGTIGTGAGALTALFVIIIMYVKVRRGWMSDVRESERAGTEALGYRQISQVLLLTVLPVILSTAVYNLCGIIDAEIYASTMVSGFGMDPSDVAAKYGTFTGRYKILINIPIAISNSLSSSLIPVISRARASGDADKVNESIGTAFRFTAMIALPCSVGLTVLGGPIVTMLLGKSDLAESMMLAGSFAVLFYSTSTVSNAILQGSGYMRLPVLHSVLSMGIHIAGLLLMMYVLKLGPRSLVFAHMLFAACMCLFNDTAIRRKLSYRIEWKKIYIIPFICSLVMGAAVYALRALTEKYISTSSVVVVSVCLVAGVIVYAVMTVVTGSITLDELSRFPIIGRLSGKIVRKKTSRKGK